jgi:hypothetical protein
MSKSRENKSRLQIRRRRYFVSLSSSPYSNLLHATVKFECDIVNKSFKFIPLFKERIVTRGFNDHAPDNPYVFKDFQINGKPARFQKTTSGPNRSIFCNKKARPRSSYHVSYTEEFMVREEDYIRRLITIPTKDLEVIVTHPKDLKASLKWFVPLNLAPKTSKNLHASSSSIEIFSEKLEGELAEDEGFELYWSRKPELGPKEKFYIRFKHEFGKEEPSSKDVKEVYKYLKMCIEHANLQEIKVYRQLIWESDMHFSRFGKKELSMKLLKETFETVEKRHTNEKNGSLLGPTSQDIRVVNSQDVKINQQANSENIHKHSNGRQSIAIKYWREIATSIILALILGVISKILAAV